MGALMPQKITPMAIIYDFDGTLAPGNVQEHQFIPDISMTPEEFWAEVNRLSKKHQADGILMYMYLMLKKASELEVPVKKANFKKHGRDILLFPGVCDWFDRVDKYGEAEGVQIKHYIVSSGTAEIIEGTSIKAEFDQIYASRFMFDHHGIAVWPALAVNFTLVNGRPIWRRA